MNNDIPTPNSEHVKPCRKCGAQDRNKAGNCKPCAKENVRKWREDNPERKADYALKYREDNREHLAEYNRQWREVNREQIAENTRQWQKANPDKVAENAHNRRAKVRGNGGALSKGIVKCLMTLQKGKCACGCGADLKKTGYHLDHIMPIALGGKNDDNNVQLLTPTCNRKKSAKHPDDWARGLGRLI